MRRLISISHEAVDRRQFDRNILDSMQALTAAVHRQRDEESDVEGDFKLKDKDDLLRANQKYRDRHQFSKLVCRSLLITTLF